MQSNRETMKKNAWKILHMIGIVVVVATVALLVECVVFQQNAIRHKQKPYELNGLNRENVEIMQKEDLAKLTDEEENAIRVQRENERLIAEYNGEEYKPEEDETLVEKNEHFYRKVKRTIFDVKLDNTLFIGKLGLHVPLEESGGYQVTLYQDDKQIADGLFCSINPKIDAGIMNVGRRANRVKIVLTTQTACDASEVTLSIRNDFTINVLRYVFLFVLIGSTCYLLFQIFYGRFLVDKPEIVFMCLAFLLGGMIICGVGTNQVGFDEYAHAKTAYDLSFGSTIETTEAAMQMKGNLLPYFNNAAERALVEAYEQQVATEIAPDITHQSRMVRTETRVYYPMAAGFWLGRQLGCDFATMVMLAKFGNLICYILVFALAIKLSKQYKLLVTLIGLLPNNLFIASSITYDAVVTAFLTLGTVLMLNELLEPIVKLHWGKVLLMLFCFEVGCLSKPIYIFMALMLLFLGKDKFYTRWQEVIFKVALLMMAGLMLYNIFKPTPVSGGDYALVSNFSYAGDPRNMGASVTGQIKYIVQNPMAYAALLLDEMGKMLGDYLSCRAPFVGYAYLGFAPGYVNFVLIICYVLAALFTLRERQYYVAKDKRWFKKSALGLPYTLLMLLMCFGVSAVIWTSMYVSYTAVGADTILGVQGRYFIPLFLPFLSCLFLKRPEDQKAGRLIRIWNKIPARAMYGVLIYVSVLLNLIMTYVFIIKQLNL